MFSLKERADEYAVKAAIEAKEMKKRFEQGLKRKPMISP